jgi:signal transduction histidine kinase
MRLMARAPRAEDIESAEKDRFSELRQRIKLPVTNLRGSLDLLKLSGIKYDDKSKKVLSGLEESAEQLTSLLNDE